MMARVEDRIRINISGRVIETRPDVLARYPDTLLGRRQARLRYWDPTRQEYYLEGYMPAVEAIFQFYQSGSLKRPLEVDIHTFLEQLEYFQMGRDLINAFKRMEGVLPDREEDQELPPEGARRTLWRLLEHPRSSTAAKVLALSSVCFVILSTFTLCLETVPRYQHGDCRQTVIDGVPVTVPNFLNEFFLLEVMCVAWFTVESSMRFYACPARRRFFRSPLNVIDFATIVPFYVTLALMIRYNDCSFGKKSAAISVMRLLRVFRMFKLSKHSRTLQIWFAALRASLDGLLIFLFLVSLTCMIFGSVIYYVEVDADRSQIRNIPDGIWWAVASVTTVGYGDVVPVTWQGRCVGCVCVLTGVLVVALPSPIIINKFNKFYRMETGRGYEMELANERNR